MQLDLQTGGVGPTAQLGCRERSGSNNSEFESHLHVFTLLYMYPQKLIRLPPEVKKAMQLDLQTGRVGPTAELGCRERAPVTKERRGTFAIDRYCILKPGQDRPPITSLENTRLTSLCKP